MKLDPEFDEIDDRLVWMNTVENKYNAPHFKQMQLEEMRRFERENLDVIQDFEAFRRSNWIKNW